MLATQTQIEALADRIECTYRLRRPDWNPEGSNRRVWAVAAASLLQACELDPLLPADPVLYVAAQPRSRFGPEPWKEIVGSAAVRRYRQQVRGIIRSLRDEILAEVGRAERLIREGGGVAAVLCKTSRRMSPLASYIVAGRSGESALAARFRAAAVAQQASCPLYRAACSEWLGPGAELPLPAEAPSPCRRPRYYQVHLN